MMTGVFSEKMYLPNLPRRPPVAALSSLSRANGISFVNNLFANPIGVFLLSQPGQTAKKGGERPKPWMWSKKDDENKEGEDKHEGNGIREERRHFLW